MITEQYCQALLEVYVQRIVMDLTDLVYCAVESKP